MRNKFCFILLPRGFCCCVRGDHNSGRQASQSERLKWQYTTFDILTFSLSARPEMRCTHRFIFMQIKLKRPRSIYQYADMPTRLTEQACIFGDVFLVSKFLLEIERQKKSEQIAILTRKPREQLYNITLDHVRLLIFYTWCRNHTFS